MANERNKGLKKIAKDKKFPGVILAHSMLKTFKVPASIVKPDRTQERGSK
ncbi:MAG TPA: hypothetical protein VNJ01_05295 [Bacteriovoracaceae bacterium]|nr:hypothetical protein [Bacteriovoracaceae bacterium]